MFTMKVYVAIYWNYSDNEILGIYQTKKEALAVAKEYREKQRYWNKYMSIDIYTHNILTQESTDYKSYFQEKGDK